MRDAEHKAYLLLLALVTAAFFRILLPFYGACFWAVIFAILFNPMHRSFERRLGVGSNRAALASLGACVVIAVLPLLFIGGALVEQAGRLVALVRQGSVNLPGLRQKAEAFLPGWADQVLERFGGIDGLEARFAQGVVAASEFLAGQAVSIGQDALRLFVGIGIMLYVLYFLFRDGHSIGPALRDSLPLSRSYSARLLARFAAVVRATVKGNFVIAIVQGSIGGLAFWLIGIDGALLWGMLMMLMSLVPAVGSAIVWLPTTLWLLLSGQVGHGVTLLGAGVLISVIDNLLRPRLVGRESRLPDYVVLVSTLGGLSVFGPNGFVIGPLIASLFFAGWGLYREERDATEPRSLVRSDGRPLLPGEDA